MSNRIIQFTDGSSQSSQESARHEKLKQSWHFVSPPRLYDLCVETLARSPLLILTKAHGKKRSKYTLAEQVGPLPSNICKSLIKQYAKIYLEQLGKIERRNYFQIINKKQTDRSGTPELISFYDFLMALASKPDKANLAYVDYRQCMNARSTLEQRLQQREESDVRSIRSKQPVHLKDRDLRLILKHKCEYLEICPCELTNKSIYMINKHLTKHLKYLRLQNCCNWVGRREANTTEPAPNEEEDNDEENDDFYLDNLREYLEEKRGAQKEEVDEEEEDEDTGDFDAYLQEYVSRYEQQQRDEMSVEQMMDDEEDEEGHAKDMQWHKRRHKRKHRRQHNERKRKQVPRQEVFKFFIEGRNDNRRSRRRKKRTSSNQWRLFSCKEETETSGERQETTSSLLKWIVKCAVQNSKPERSADSTSSFIEQIKQKAAILAETKMLDKVCSFKDSFKLPFFSYIYLTTVILIMHKQI